MGLREWSVGGVLLSPFLIYVVLALLVTGALRMLLRLTPVGRWIWHEALFDCALYVCVLTVITVVLGPYKELNMRTPVRVAITLCLVALAIFAGFHLWQYYMLTPWTRDARIRADVVVISPDVSGWVRELKVHDNQEVKAGDLLLSIDRDRFEAALDKAKAVVETRQQQLNLREREASRRASLGPQAISAELRENAQINAGIARGELREAQAEAKVAEINLARSQVHAPRNGHITNLRLAEGNYVNAGQSVMALIDDSTFYVQAYFEETKLPRIRVGDPVKVWLMSAGDALHGTVESISRGITDRNTTPDGQLLAEVEPTFNWVRLAQRIPVRIKLDKVPEGINLSAGMTASVQVQEAH